jgi:hypothetical protein
MFSYVLLRSADLNENDWDEPDWRQSFYGDSYARLLGIKKTVDATGIFVCRHCVGDEST